MKLRQGDSDADSSAEPETMEVKSASGCVLCMEAHEGSVAGVTTGGEGTPGNDHCGRTAESITADRILCPQGARPRGAARWPKRHRRKSRRTTRARQMAGHPKVGRRGRLNDEGPEYPRRAEWDMTGTRGRGAAT